MDFDVPVRYDEGKAAEGIWFEIENENGFVYGSFKLRLIDNLSQKVEAERKRSIAKFKIAKKITGKISDEELVKANLIYLSLVDWKVTAGGKPVDFSIENALKYFDNPNTNFVMFALMSRAVDVTNFASGDQLEDAAEVEKN